MVLQFGALLSRGEQMQGRAAQWLSEWFLSRKKFKGDPAMLVNTNYFESGMLTSLEVVEFVTGIENQFGVQFSDRDFEDVRFATIAGLSELIAERAAKDGQQT